MEAPKLEQLLKVAEVVNPNWYPFVYGYLKGELDSLELDSSDEDLESYYPELNLGNYDTCVVGESLGFKKKYSHNGFDNCFICGRFADNLFYNSGTTDTDADGNDVPEIEDQRMIFAENLRDFYIHMGYMK